MTDALTTRTAPPIVELRQYRLRPGRRDDLIELFDREFVEAQEAVGIEVLGQFRDLDRPEHFVWVRGFDDMDSRRTALAAFYGGPVWKQHREAANSTMIDSDDVLLLHPVSVDDQFVVGNPDSRDHARGSGVVVALIQHRQARYEADLDACFAAELRPQLEAAGIRTLGVYETEPAENTFPQLPVRVANVLVWFGALEASEHIDADLMAIEQLPAWPSTDALARRFSAAAPDLLRLVPTSRSLLGGRA